jgi:hypothetical protein|tara:strand:- start:139 stop:474 length:336 start_codon:yes stop_codon:yes gene_type:complete
MSKKKESYFSTIKQSEWGGIDDKMKEIVFHKYFLGDVKDRYGNRWNDDNKNTKRLYDFVSKRKFDEYGNVTDKICGYCGSLYPIERFGKEKSSRDGYSSRIKEHRSKRNRR